MATGTIELWPGGAEFHDSFPAECRRTDGANLPYVGLFFDPSAVETAYWTFRVPTNYDGGNVTLTLGWRTTATSGSAVFGVSLRSVAVGAAWDAAFSEQTGSSAAQGTASRYNEVSFVFTPGQSGFVAGQVAQFQLRRIGNDSGDTLTVDAEVLDVKVDYTVGSG